MSKLTFIVLIVVILIISGCSYQAWHEGLKQSQRSQCGKLMKPDRQNCFDSLEYSHEEYERERKKNKK